MPHPGTLSRGPDRAATTDTRPVFGYIRVSTDRQETERQEQTLPVRHASLPDGLADSPLDLFYDHGISAWSGKTRPGFDAMRARIANGEAAAIIIDTSSRLTRQGIESALTFLFGLRETQTRLFTTQGGEYTLDLAGIIRLAVDADSDERYSTNLSHHVASAKATRARSGHWSHGDLPPGYRFNTDTREVEATDDLPAITEAFARFVRGDTYATIADYLTEHLSLESRVRRSQHHATITRDRLRGMMSNPLYAGMIRHKEELFPGNHPPAVDETTFERAQARLRRQAKDHAAREPKNWPLGGIARHGGCEGRGSLRTHTVKRNGHTYYYARCSDCAKSSMNLASVEASVICGLATVAHALDAILTANPDYGIPSDEGSTLEEARAGLAEAKARVKKLGRLIADDALDADDPEYLAGVRERDAYQSAVEKLSTQGKDWREELASLAATILSLADEFEPDPATARMLADDPIALDLETGRDIFGDHTVARVLLGWQHADFERRRNVIHRSLERAVIGPEEIELHFRIGLPQEIRFFPSIALRGRDDHTSELEASGFGASNSSSCSSGIPYSPTSGSSGFNRRVSSAAFGQNATQSHPRRW
jgi:DNA invertase Pin-like site-specific DNA recombinase